MLFRKKEAINSLLQFLLIEIEATFSCCWCNDDIHGGIYSHLLETVSAIKKIFFSIDYSILC